MNARPRVPASAWGALGLYAIFALTVPRFGSLANMQNLLRVASILGIAACGQAIVILLGGIEFSFGSSVGLASIVTVLAVPPLGVAGAFLAGACVVIAIGLVNGVLIAWFRIPPFIVTLGMLMAVFGLAATLAGGLPIDAPAGDSFTWVARGRLQGVPVPVFLAIGAATVLHGLLTRTGIGRRWALVGSNAAAARRAGIAVPATIIAGYGAAAAFCALGAVIYTSRVASGQPALAPNLAFDTIAACAIGGLSLAGGQARTSQVVSGVLILAALNNAVVLLNFPTASQQLLTAAILIAAVLVQSPGHPAFRRRSAPGARAS